MACEKRRVTSLKSRGVTCFAGLRLRGLALQLAAQKGEIEMCSMLHKPEIEGCDAVGREEEYARSDVSLA